MTERDTEQSMEDILASIRRIIGNTDGQDAADRSAGTGSPEPVTGPASAPSGAAPAGTAPAAVDTSAEPASSAGPGAGSASAAPDGEPLPPADAQGMRTDPGNGSEAARTLVSEERAQAAARLFSELGATLEAQQHGAGAPGLTVEQLVREMLRPMLKAWLDEHLPVVVERLVREEISRLSGR